MTDALDIRDLLVAISRMPEDRRNPRQAVWYESQKEHWIGWLLDYRSPGAYGRKVVEGRDARFVYNHVVCPDLLLFLAKGSGVSEQRLRAAREAARSAGTTQMAQSAAIRKQIPWELVLTALKSSGLLSRGAL